jgi:acetyl-CoA acetyltransferase family protein
MADAFIIDAVRSPIGRSKATGAFAGLHPASLLGQVIAALIDRTGIDPGVVDDVLVGCVNQVGEQSGNIGRVAWLGAGYPEHVPATTIERMCGSSQQAAAFGAQAVLSGFQDVVVVAGVESMSAVPLGSARIGRDTTSPEMAARYAPGLVSQGVAAELIAVRWELSRRQMDEYAASSHARAHESAATGGFDNEIVPIRRVVDDVERIIDTDETIRPGTDPDTLGALKPVFQSVEMSERFPAIPWAVTAGNASQVSDGASAMLITSESAAARLGLTPRARFHSFAVCGDDPLYMLTGPIPATHAVLKRSGMDIGQMDHFEVNEAFASVPLAWATELGADPANLNPDGGAIALGHPLGASGARLLTTMLNGLERRGGHYGLQTMCEAGGMANATIIELLS